ncbi:hypothetical protein [Streptococcus parasuis]|uniref:hypothetical protein n=1 Tax=Streptococcus parasuis TaxID=1501662 RepID=UPI0028A09409|nr:hypothetical protein [Streptococcus parasuis]
MTHPYAEWCKLHTNNLLAERVQKIYADMRKPLNNSDDLLVAIHTEIRYADSDRAYLLNNVLKRLEEADKRERLFYEKLSSLEYQIRQALDPSL